MNREGKGSKDPKKERHKERQTQRKIDQKKQKVGRQEIV